MNFTEIKSKRIGDVYFQGVHDSGLKVYIYPKKESNSSYAIFGTDFGSINTEFKDYKTQKVIKVPDGIAHYLEHKLFESEDGDAFKKYAKTGASANAYTSFALTGYLFSCTENFKESLKILLDFVQSPYFTEQTVEKEREIISQEIKMYSDDPDWCVMINLLKALYHKHPVRNDIAGTVESIAEINPENLYTCYNNFYNLNNMSLCISGNVNINEIDKMLEESIKNIKPVNSERIFPEEPYEIFKNYTEQKFDIAIPMFQLGFKEHVKNNERVSLEKIIATNIILEIFASKSSFLYRKLLDKNLINSSFSYEYFEGPGYASVIFSGESSNPHEVAKIIQKAADDLHENGFDFKDFERAKKAVYAQYVSSLNRAKNIGDILLSFSFNQRELFSAIDIVASITIDQVEHRLSEQLNSKNSALSVVLPL